MPVFVDFILNTLTNLLILITGGIVRITHNLSPTPDTQHNTRGV